VGADLPNSEIPAPIAGLWLPRTDVQRVRQEFPSSKWHFGCKTVVHSAEKRWYIVAENTWYILAEKRWYIIGR
jgi:hypothetical protein